MARRPKVKAFPGFSTAGGGPVGTLPMRVAPVPVRRIVGSAGKAQQLTPTFLPKAVGARSRRFRSIVQALQHGVELPPIEVYSLRREYYVIDGHNRVAAAIANGLQYLDAHIFECIVPEESLEDQLANSQMRFERRTGISRIQFTDPDSYAKLLAEIISYRDSWRQRTASLSTREAAHRWYREIFVPVAEPLDLGATTASFPGSTVSDLYFMVADHRAVLETTRGVPVTMAEALADFQALHARPLTVRVLRPLQRRARRAVWRMGGGPPVS